MPIGERLPRILCALLLPASAALFGRVSAPMGSMVSRRLKALASFETSMQMHIAWMILQSFLLACLLVLTAYQLWKIGLVFRRKATLVFLGALGSSFTAFLFLPKGTSFAAPWLISLLFLLFAAQTSLQLALMPLEGMYKEASLRTLLFLLLAGGFAWLGPRVEAAASWDVGAIVAYGALVAAHLALHLLCLRKQRTILRS